MWSLRARARGVCTYVRATSPVSKRSPWGRPVGFTLKVRDGAGEAARGREPAVASALLSLGVVRERERAAVEALAAPPLCNVAGLVIGEVRGVLRLRD